MGFLNHSTNNIIIDAVLTEKGRELLSRNDGSFNIETFRFSDDEVDYSIITQYGQVIGKEKIIKNTPIFEALTGKDVALKYTLLNLSTTDNLKFMPKLIDSSGLNSYSLTSTVSNSTADINLKTNIPSATSSYSLPQRLRDTQFYVTMHRKLLNLSTTVTPNYESDLITYIVDSSASTLTPQFSGQKFLSIKLRTSSDFTDDLYGLYGNAAKTKIKTSIQVVGRQSGASIIIPVEINLNQA